MAAKKTKASKPAPKAKTKVASKPAKAAPKTKVVEKPAAKAAKPTKPEKSAPTPKKVEKAPKVEKAVPVVVAAKPVTAEKPAKAPKAPKAEKPTPSLMARKSEAPEPKKLRGIAADAPEGLDEDGMKLFKQWNSLKEQHKNDRAPTYNLEADYPPKTPIEHKVLGWGYVLKKQNNRIEVLFREGVKILVTNYKP